MRLGNSDPGSNEYLHPEPLLNNIKRVSINSGTESAWAVVLVDENGNIIPNVAYDYWIRSVLSNVETYVYKIGGSGGTTVLTKTITYTDSSLSEIVSGTIT